MTNKKFKYTHMKLDREQLAKELAHKAKNEEFLALAHALDPLVNACETLGSQAWFAKASH